jgi:hypothetical protein
MLIMLVQVVLYIVWSKLPFRDFRMQDHIREVFEISGFLQILTVVGTQLEAEEMIRSYSSN